MKWIEQQTVSMTIAGPMRPWKIFRRVLIPLIVLGCLISPAWSQDDPESGSEGIEDGQDGEDGNDSGAYENVVVSVRITNISQGQIFSRSVVATHRRGFELFALGRPARATLGELAETGNPVPLASVLAGADFVRDVKVTEAALMPGESAVLHLRGAPRLSLAGMMVRTNDGFFGLSGARVPLKRPRRVRLSPGYDAGTEVNDELCSSVPGTPCGGNGGVDEESVVLIHSGIHGNGDLAPGRFDWRNPVARVEIRTRRIEVDTVP